MTARASRRSQLRPAKSASALLTVSPDGVSELFIAVLDEAGRAARSSVGVAELPLNAPVEVEVVVSLQLVAIKSGHFQT